MRVDVTCDITCYIPVPTNTSPVTLPVNAPLKVVAVATPVTAAPRKVQNRYHPYFYHQLVRRVYVFGIFKCIMR